MNSYLTNVAITIIYLVAGCMWNYRKTKVIDNTDYFMLIVLPWIWPVVWPIAWLIVARIIWKKIMTR